MIHRNPLPPIFNDDKSERSNRCPLCGIAFNPFESKILKENNKHKLLYTNCRGCQNSIITLYSFDDFGISVLGLFVDLKEKDARKFMQQKPINADFVIEAYGKLKDEKNLLKIFKQE